MHWKLDIEREERSGHSGFEFEIAEFVGDFFDEVAELVAAGAVDEAELSVVVFGSSQEIREDLVTYPSQRLNIQGEMAGAAFEVVGDSSVEGFGADFVHLSSK